MHVSQLMDDDLLDQMVKEGYIRVQVHPTKPLSVYNYSEKAQWERVWNPATRQCRGLILDADKNVIARPFPKFFNHGEPDASEFEEGPIRVYDKLDGSLGVLYQWEDEWAVATRGSFTSDQAIWATQWFKKLGWAPPDWLDNAYTWLFEILYPGNRIVVDYQGKEALVLLDVIGMATGLSAMESEVPFLWPGDIVEQFEYASVIDVLAAEPRANREGFVIYHEATGDRVKVKYEEYVRLHRLVTGVTARSVWDLLYNKVGTDELLENVPDEFYEWVNKTADNLIKECDELMRSIEQDYAKVSAEANSAMAGAALEAREARKIFALTAQRLHVAHMSGMFLLLDGNRDKLVDYCWKQVKPAADRPFNTTLLEEEALG